MVQVWEKGMVMGSEEWEQMGSEASRLDHRGHAEKWQLREHNESNTQKTQSGTVLDSTWGKQGHDQ